MKKLIPLLLVALLIALCGMTALADADNSLVYVKDKGNIVIGFDEGFPPMGFKDETGAFVGFDIDVAREVAAIIGVELKLQPINWDAKVEELNTKNIDAIWNGLSITPARLEALTFSLPYMNNAMVLVTMKNVEISGLSDFSGKNIGLQAGSYAQDALDEVPEFKAIVNVVEFDENMTAFMDLKNGGVDAVLVDLIFAGYYIVQNPEIGYAIQPYILADDIFGVGLRKDEINLKAAIDGALVELAENGKLAEISKKWFSADIVTGVVLPGLVVVDTVEVLVIDPTAAETAAE